MKRTEKDIYDFVSSRITELRKKLDEHHGILEGDSILDMIQRLEAYEDVINFIGTIRSGNPQSLYPEVINKDKLVKLIKDKVMCLVNLEDEDYWPDGHKYFIYDNELYEREEITQEEFIVLKFLKEDK